MIALSREEESTSPNHLHSEVVARSNFQDLQQVAIYNHWLIRWESSINCKTIFRTRTRMRRLFFPFRGEEKRRSWRQAGRVEIWFVSNSFWVFKYLGRGRFQSFSVWLSLVWVVAAYQNFPLAEFSRSGMTTRDVRGGRFSHGAGRGEKARKSTYSQNFTNLRILKI